MDITRITPDYSVSNRIHSEDLHAVKILGFKTVIYFNSENKESSQLSSSNIAEAANRHGLISAYIPVNCKKITSKDISVFHRFFAKSPKPILAVSESNICSILLWTMAHTPSKKIPEIISRINQQTNQSSKIKDPSPRKKIVSVNHIKVAIIGGGCAGIAVATNLLQKNSSLDIAIIDPSEMHYHQPAWTMVGGGIFSDSSTAKKMTSVIPTGAKFINDEVVSLDPELNKIQLKGNKEISYEILVICPGVKLNWEAINGLNETIGKNNVTSNYRYDLAPYTWHLVQRFNKGDAIFTQPKLPIKCTYAPQKAMYLSAEHWVRQKRIKNISLNFYSAENITLVDKKRAENLKDYAGKNSAKFHFNHDLIKVDGDRKYAYFKVTDSNANSYIVEKKFDLIHVVPPQRTPDFIYFSNLVDIHGWLEVNPKTLRHIKYENIYGLGDVINLPDKKTAAAAIAQAKITAMNILFDLKAVIRREFYNGYGSVSLITKYGDLNLAEYGYADRCYLDFLSAT